MFQVKILQISKKCTNLIKLDLLSWALTYGRRHNPLGSPPDVHGFFFNPTVVKGKLPHLETSSQFTKPGGAG